ncbi:hypothetical protein [Mesorhizobium sp.]|uniref:hypothetical protein n=1 Tax=Mesorhizobium sp. TaxID=1871066 RepID=UPI0011FCEDAF|nr:hypothetical protein [Mesorhizobium sp.]TIM05511.1 MAG: hypothetical protein E5Y62_27355 [Mesorhizobium sp.]
MISPHLYRLYLRPASGTKLTIEVSKDRIAWRDTGLSIDTIQSGDATATIGALLQNFIQLDSATDIEPLLPYRKQMAIGRQLNTALFGPDAPPFVHSHLHLVPVLKEDMTDSAEDFFDLFLRLPWALLTEEDDAGAAFLALRRINPSAITIDAAPKRDGTPRFSEVKLPPWPKVLIICPLLSETATNGATHLADLEAVFKPHYKPPDYEAANRSNRLKTVHTYSDFVRCLSDDAEGFIPHIVYYYGHAKAEENDTLFEFDPEPDGRDGVHSLDDLIDPLKSIHERTNFPPIIWINACQGGAAKRNNVVRRLAPFASVVIATRQVAVIQDSMALGLLALPMIAIDGMAPPVALSRAISQMAKSRPQDAVMAARWATTILAVQYDLWSALGTEDRNIIDPESVGDAPMRLDRSVPLGQIERYFNDALQGSTNAPHAILWHGLPEDGTEVFAQRFIDFVSERFANWSAVNYPVELQLSALPKNDTEIHFRDRIYRALNKADEASDLGIVSDVSVKAAIDNLSDGQPTLLTFTHGPFNTSHVEALRDYLGFWQSLFTNLDLDPEKTRIVLGLRFVREEAASTLVAQSGAFEQVLLDEVPSDELSQHIERFCQLYGFNAKTIDKTTVELTRNHGKRFRPLHLALERKFRLSVWKDRLDKAGDQP